MMLCDSRQWKQYPESIKYFMSHHRHYHTDIIFCSQSYKDTDLRIRNLAQQFLYIERSGAFTRVSPIHHLMDIKQGSIDDWYEKGGRLASRYIRRSKYYHMFDSHSTKPLLPLPQKPLGNHPRTADRTADRRTDRRTDRKQQHFDSILKKRKPAQDLTLRRFLYCQYRKYTKILC